MKLKAHVPLEAFGCQADESCPEGPPSEQFVGAFGG